MKKTIITLVALAFIFSATTATAEEVIGGPIAMSDLEMICDWEGYEDLIPLIALPLPNDAKIEASVTLAVMYYTGMKYLYMKDYGEASIKKNCVAASWTTDLEGKTETRALDESSLMRFKEAVRKLTDFLEKTNKPDFKNVRREA